MTAKQGPSVRMAARCFDEIAEMSLPMQVKVAESGAGAGGARSRGGYATKVDVQYYGDQQRLGRMRESRNLSPRPVLPNIRCSVSHPALCENEKMTFRCLLSIFKTQC